MTKKISKVIVYYEDGTYQEITHSVPNVQGEKDKTNVSPSTVTPDLRPDTQKIQEWPTPRPPWTPYQPTWVSPTTDPTLPPWTVTCDNGNVPLKYTIGTDGTWSFTSTSNADNFNKYTITSTGNGNVDLSK